MCLLYCNKLAKKPLKIDRCENNAYTYFIMYIVNFFLLLLGNVVTRR